MRLIGRNIDTPVWDCPAFVAPTKHTSQKNEQFPVSMSILAKYSVFHKNDINVTCVREAMTGGSGSLQRSGPARAIFEQELSVNEWRCQIL